MRNNKKNTQDNGKLRKQALEKELKRIISLLIKGYHPQRIILFGSLASGEVTVSSDIDLAVIKPSRKKFLDRIQEILFLIKPRLAVDILAYTPQEFAVKVKEEAYFFVEELQRKGKVIYEREK